MSTNSSISAVSTELSIPAKNIRRWIKFGSKKKSGRSAFLPYDVEEKLLYELFYQHKMLTRLNLK